ncbi:hypothetical protein NDU88_004163 [Pleurodeles waltl]|uniref:Uncharacterized protein n=1 Tax=Pleurodeles waltl TaxID=8319 RepID=A0AAV7T8C5_PLEWA|nr:hypothetical protein NDU88_004163 [Pleurodeles waltl]
MRILIRHTDKKVTKLQGDIEALEKEIDEVTQKDLVKKNYEILDKIIDDYQMYLRDKKLRKVKRYDLDYKLGRIYTFTCKYDNVKISESSTIRRQDTVDTDLSSGSSISSIDSCTSKESGPSTRISRDLSNQNNFLVEMERLRQGTKIIRKDTRPEGVGNDGNKDTGKSGVKTRSKKD